MVVPRISQRRRVAPPDRAMTGHATAGPAPSGSRKGYGMRPPQYTDGVSA